MTHNLHTNIQLLRLIMAGEYGLLYPISTTVANNCDNNCNNYKFEAEYKPKTCTITMFYGIWFKKYYNDPVIRFMD